MLKEHQHIQIPIASFIPPKKKEAKTSLNAVTPRSRLTGLSLRRAKGPNIKPSERKPTVDAGETHFVHLRNHWNDCDSPNKIPTNTGFNHGLKVVRTDFVHPKETICGGPRVLWKHSCIRLSVFGPCLKAAQYGSPAQRSNLSLQLSRMSIRP